MPTLSCPGKVFLFGEYAVLAGAPGWIAAIGPRFELREIAEASFPFAAGSPAGRLWGSTAHPPQARLSWRDPHQGRGGFGASSAQFLLCAKKLDPQATVESTLRQYHALHANEEVPPSGADVAAQWVGGVVRYVKGGETRPVAVDVDFSRVLLFSATNVAGRKVNTHEHLARLGRVFFLEYARPLAEMKAILHEADRELAENDSLDTDAVARLMNAYADTLYRAGLETPLATDDRQALSALPNVTAVKGTGAGLSDAIWVILDAGAPAAAREAVVRRAETRGLQLVTLNRWENGIAEEKQ